MGGDLPPMFYLVCGRMVSASMLGGILSSNIVLQRKSIGIILYWLFSYRVSFSPG